MSTAGPSGGAESRSVRHMSIDQDLARGLRIDGDVTSVADCFNTVSEVITVDLNTGDIYRDGIIDSFGRKIDQESLQKLIHAPEEVVANPIATAEQEVRAAVAEATRVESASVPQYLAIPASMDRLELEDSTGTVRSYAITNNTSQFSVNTNTRELLENKNPTGYLVTIAQLALLISAPAGAEAATRTITIPNTVTRVELENGSFAKLKREKGEVYEVNADRFIIIDGTLTTHRVSEDQYAALTAAPALSEDDPSGYIDVPAGMPSLQLEDGTMLSVDRDEQYTVGRDSHYVYRNTGNTRKRVSVLQFNALKNAPRAPGGGQLENIPSSFTTIQVEDSVGTVYTMHLDPTKTWTINRGEGRALYKNGAPTGKCVTEAQMNAFRKRPKESAVTRIDIDPAIGNVMTESGQSIDVTNGSTWSFGETSRRLYENGVDTGEVLTVEAHSSLLNVGNEIAERIRLDSDRGTVNTDQGAVNISAGDFYMGLSGRLYHGNERHMVGGSECMLIGSDFTDYHRNYTSIAYGNDRVVVAPDINTIRLDNGVEFNIASGARGNDGQWEIVHHPEPHLHALFHNGTNQHVLVEHQQYEDFQRDWREKTTLEPSIRIVPTPAEDAANKFTFETDSGSPWDAPVRRGPDPTSSPNVVILARSTRKIYLNGTDTGIVVSQTELDNRESEIVNHNLRQPFVPPPSPKRTTVLDRMMTPARGVWNFLGERAPGARRGIGGFLSGQWRINQAWRRLTQGGNAKIAANIATTTVSAAASAGATAGSIGAVGLTTSVASKVLNATTTGLVGGSVIAPISGPATILITRAISGYNQGQISAEEFERTICVLCDGDDGLRDALIDNFDRDMKLEDDRLLDEDQEVDLIQVLHRTNLVGPNTCPYMSDTMGGHSHYARHSYAYMTALCAYADTMDAAARSIIESTVPADTPDRDQVINERWNHFEQSFNRLSDTQKQLLANFNTINPTEPTPDPDTGRQSLEKRREFVRQASISHGRLVCNFHRDSREAQVTGSSIGPALAVSAIASVTTGGLGIVTSFPLIGSAATVGARKLNSMYRNSRSNLEFNPADPEGAEITGKQGGTLVSPEVYARRGGAQLYQQNILAAWKDKAPGDTDLRNAEQKHWYAQINLKAMRPGYDSKSYSSPDHLAKYCAAAVQSGLAKVDPPAVDHDKNIEDAEKKLESLIAKADSAIQRAEQSLDRFTHQRTQILTTLGGRTRLDQTVQDQLKDSLKELGPKITAAEGALSAAQDAKQNSPTIVIARERLQEAQDAKIAPVQRLTPAQVGTNQDIIAAFSLKIQQEYKVLNERKTWGGSAGSMAGKGLKAMLTSEPAKQVGQVIAVGGFYGSVAAYVGSAYLGLSALPVGMAVGVMTGVGHIFKKWRGK